MKKVAIISDMYYPDMSSPSSVIDKYVQAMKGKDYEFHILTVSYVWKKKPLEDEDVKLHYIFNLKSRVRAWCLWHIKHRYYYLIAKPMMSLLRLHTYIISQFKYPLSTSWEIDKYVKLYDKLGIEFDALVSVSNTICSQFAAKRIKEKHPSVKWITFFTDPFTDHYIYYPVLKNKVKLRKRHFDDEFAIYNTADYNMLTSELYFRALKDFGQPLEKTYKIDYVLSDIRKLTVNKTQSCKDDCVNVIYAGAIYRKIRNPETMLSVFSRLEGVKLDMYIKGNDCNDILDKYKSSQIHIYACANREEYLKMICNDYDILINMGNISNLQTPSKPLELLSTGKPVINFYIKKDSQYELFEKYPLGLNVNGKEPDVIDIVKTFCEKCKGKQLGYEEIERLYPNNLLENQTKLLEKLINA